jgi:hypothetical protein
MYVQLPLKFQLLHILHLFKHNFIVFIKVFININLYNCSCNFICCDCICIVFIVCSVSLIFCVVLCVLFEMCVMLCDVCYLCCVLL